MKKKIYVIESSGFRNFNNSIERKKNNLEKIKKELAEKYNMTVEEFEKELKK